MAIGVFWIMYAKYLTDGGRIDGPAVFCRGLKWGVDMIQQMTVMRIAADKEKEQRHETPLFPCSVYVTDWQRGSIEGCPWHWHKDLELMYVAMGQVQVECSGQQTVLKEGDGLFFNSKALHRYQMVGEEKCHICYLVFNPDFVTGGVGTVYHQKYVAPLVSDASFPCQFLYGAGAQDAEIIGRIRAAFAAARQGSIGYEYDVRYNVSKALLQLLLDYQPLALASKHMTPQMERLQEMLDFLHWHFSEDVSLAQLAGSAGISSREAQRCFKGILHTSPMEYLHHYRMQVAEELLLGTSDSVLDVGISCGFQNPSHFIKSFRKYRGCTPRVFRQRNAGGALGFFRTEYMEGGLSREHR